MTKQKGLRTRKVDVHGPSMRADMEERSLRCISLAQKLPVQKSVLDGESMGRGGGGRKVQREGRGEESRERRADKEKMIEKSKKHD